MTKIQLWRKEGRTIVPDGYGYREAEVERLKKELEGKVVPDGMIHQPSFHLGLVEGERRAMEKVKEYIEKVPNNLYSDDNLQWENGYDAALKDLKEHFGLGEEVKK